MLGDILEIGEEAQEIHEKIGQICSELKIKTVFLFGQNANNILKGYPSGIVLLDKKRAAKEILALRGEGDALLVKGSRGISLEEILLDMKENKNE